MDFSVSLRSLLPLPNYSSIVTFRCPARPAYSSRGSKDRSCIPPSLNHPTERKTALAGDPGALRIGHLCPGSRFAQDDSLRV